MTNDENFEYEIYELIMERLKDKFKIIDNNILYRYLRLRFLAQYIDRYMEVTKNFKELFIDFIINELNLSFINKKIYYKYTEITKLNHERNCFENIIDDWIFRANLNTLKNVEGLEISIDDYISNQWNEISFYAKRKSKKYRKDNNYKYYLRYNALYKLNTIYGINKNEILDKKIQGFIYDFSHDYSPIICEDICERYIQLSNLPSTNINLINERILEDFMIKNLELIEEGLVYIKRQVRVINGILDILAKDRNNNYVIIELKVEADKDIVWQVNTYFKEFKSLYNIKEVRVITLFPKYPEYIKNILGKFNFVEMFEFIPYINNKKIENIKFKKIS